MRQMIDKIMNCYGSPVILHQDHLQHELRAFLQPVTGKNKQNSLRSMEPLGEEILSQYIYYGPAAPQAKPGDWLEVNGKSYEFRRTELIEDWNGPVYCWGVCAAKGGVDNWAVKL